MPTYTYECKKCGNSMDVFHSMSESPKITCDACGGKSVTRLLGTGAGVIFKGSGFYETDYKDKGGKKGGKSSKSESSGSAESSSKTESKSETKSESKSSSKKGGSE